VKKVSLISRSLWSRGAAAAVPRTDRPKGHVGRTAERCADAGHALTEPATRLANWGRQWSFLLLVGQQFTQRRLEDLADRVVRQGIDDADFLGDLELREHGAGA
jgi:hypothetical protein